MRKTVVTAAALGTVVLASGCGKNVNNADHLLERLNTDARIVCLDKAVDDGAGVQTVRCNEKSVNDPASAFTIRVFDDQKKLAETLAEGSDDPTVTGYNWLITSPSLETARMIRAVVGGHLQSSVPQGKSALDE